jgi:hypothetical protein
VTEVDPEKEAADMEEELNKATELEMEKSRKQKEWFDKITA